MPDLITISAGVYALFIALGTGIVTGLIAWGGIRVELRYMRRDIDRIGSKLERHLEAHRHGETEITGPR